jgi:hypothetical protein
LKRILLLDFRGVIGGRRKYLMRLLLLLLSRQAFSYLLRAKTVEARGDQSFVTLKQILEFVVVILTLKAEDRMFVNDAH